VLTEADRGEFAEWGFVRLHGAFDPDAAEAMRRVVGTELGERYGVHPDDRRTWTIERPNKLVRAKSDSAFDAIGSEGVLGVFDELIGIGLWRRPRTWGQVMVTFANASQPWVVPHGLWHVDFQYDAPPEPLFGLKVFAFFGDVHPSGGGTLVIRGSHRLVTRFVAEQPLDRRQHHRATRLAFMQSHPWLKALASPEYGSTRTADLMGTDSHVDGVAVRVVELTGEAGDVVIAHPWLVHHTSYNTSREPRFMRAVSIYRSTETGKA